MFFKNTKIKELESKINILEGRIAFLETSNSTILDINRQLNENLLTFNKILESNHKTVTTIIETQSQFLDKQIQLETAIHNLYKEFLSKEENNA